ncbi:hypothetical protein AVEN_57384-1, partial [Araneus ventricosus]
LLSGLGGSYLEFRNNADVIDKQWRKLMINPLSKEELTQVISTKWPALSIFIPRILNVYSLFSADLRELCENSNGQEPLNAYLKHGRLISMSPPTTDVIEMLTIGNYFKNQSQFSKK